jgi:hypothetical protein
MNNSQLSNMGKFKYALTLKMEGFLAVNFRLRSVQRL